MSEQTETVLWCEDLCARYKKSRVTIWRWATNGILPKPDVKIFDKPGWYRETILEFERQSAQSVA